MEVCSLVEVRIPWASTLCCSTRSISGLMLSRRVMASESSSSLTAFSWSPDLLRFRSKSA